MKILHKSSLRLRLTVILSFAALIIWLLSTSIAWFQAREEANEMFDAQQILFAKRLASSNLRHILIERQRRGGFRDFEPKHPKHFDDDALAFAIFTRQGEILLSDDSKGKNFVFEPVRGFSKARIQNDDDPWRIFWLPSDDGHLIIAVGQELDYRSDLINKVVFGQMWIWLACLPLLITLIILVINKELKLLQQVSDEVIQRSPEDNTLLKTENVPSEILPLVQNLNEFFNRTSMMLLRERRFTSDAAHELRSPLAALRIQTELAQMADDDPSMRTEALRNLTLGIDRATQLIEQLLTLSRLDSLKQLENAEEIHWDKLLPSVIGELYFNAQKRKMEIEYNQLDIPRVRQGQPLLLCLMVRNVIDNAIRYCPEGSLIKVTLMKNSIVVEDNGGGVTEEDLAKLGQRFYRPAGQNEKGSGLGLSIVRRIAELHHYKVKLENVTKLHGEPNGLRVRFELS